MHGTLRFGNLIERILDAQVELVGWEGDCSGTDPECTLEISGDTRVIARFDRSG